MTFDLVRFVPAAAIANTGTLTIGYPTDRSRGDYNFFSKTNQHRLQVNGNSYVSPTNFTLAFNANTSGITFTNVNMGVIPAGANCTLQINRAGADSGIPRVLPVSAVKQIRATTYLIDLGSPKALATNGLALSQSVSAATAALLNGTGGTTNPNGSITLDFPRNVTGAWTTSTTVTVRGFDEYGVAMTETSASGTTFTGKKAFKTVTSITPVLAITGATFGFGDVMGLPVAIHNASQITSELIDGLAVGGRATKVRLPYVLEQASLLAGVTAAAELVSPIAGTISLLSTNVRTAIGTGGTIQVINNVTNSVGGVAIIANSAVKGAAQLVTPTIGDASQNVAKNGRIQVAPASFATSGAVEGFVEITPADALTSGAIVLGDGTLATALTGDVRGTYVPELPNNGSRGIALIVHLADPSDLGVTQF